MKKRIIQVLFSLLPLCMYEDIFAQENNKRNKTPWSGVVSLNYDFTNNFTGNINLEYNREKWDLHVDYSGHSDRIEISSELFRIPVGTSIKSLQKIETEQHHLSHAIGLQLNLRPSSRNLFFGEFKLQFPKITTNQDVSNNGLNDGVHSTYDAHNRIAFSRKTIEGSLAHKYIFEENKHELSTSGVFSYTEDSRPATYHINEILSHTADGKESPRFAQLQADYLYTFANEGQLEAGIHFFSRWNKTRYYFHDKAQNSEEWVNNPNLNQGVDHSEFVYSAYLSYSRQWGEQFSCKLGLYSDYDISRTTLLQTNRKNNTNRFYPYPRLTIQYHLSDRQELALHFNRESIRPDYVQLNPYTNPIDPITFERGNPFLRPEIMNRIALQYSVTGKQVQLNSNLYFKSTEKFITPVALTTTPDTLIMTYTNGGIQNEVGWDINLPAQIFPWMSLTPSISLLHTHSTGKFQGIDLHVDDFCWSSHVELSLFAGKYTEFQASFSYQSATKVPQFKVEENHYLDLAIKQGFLKDRLQVSFSISDVFDTSKWTARSNQGPLRLENYSKEATHAYWIGLTFNFNSYSLRPTAADSHPQKRSTIKIGQ